MNENFFIKSDYIPNRPFKIDSDKEFYWTKERLEHKSLNAQYYVYNFCKELIKKTNINSILDIGCGNAVKTMKMLYPLCKNIYGIDEQKIINLIRKIYGLSTFYSDNLDKPTFNLKNKFDLILCADVIEHLQNPDNLINYIKKYSHQNTYIIISTPERDILRGINNIKSPNKSHIREWNSTEFKKYIKSRGLKIINHCVFQAFRIKIDFKNKYTDIKKEFLRRIKTLKRKNSLKKIRYNQVVICKKGFIDNYSKYIINRILKSTDNKVENIRNYIKIKIYNLFYILYSVKKIFQIIKLFFILIEKKFHLKNLLISIKSFIINFIKSENKLSIFKKRKNGISVLLPTQNEENTVELSILSLIDFADEIIVVDNGSIDNTKKIIKNLASKFKKIRFFDKPELPELYYNRQFALRQSNYRWICRFDSDYIAYTNGENNIMELREFLLALPKGFLPKIIGLSKLNIDGDFWHTRKDKFSSRGKVIRGPEIRIYEYFPFLTFTRFGRREHGSFQNFLKKIVLEKVYYWHCTIKSNLNLFLRSERSNWREFGNYKRYPTLLSYIKDTIKTKYRTENIKEALNIFLKNITYSKSNYIKYDPKKYLPYPSIILKEMENEKVFRIDKYFH